MHFRVVSSRLLPRWLPMEIESRGHGPEPQVVAVPSRIISIIPTFFANVDIIDMIRPETGTCLSFRRMRPYDEDIGETAVFL